MSFSQQAQQDHHQSHRDPLAKSSVSNITLTMLVRSFASLDGSYPLPPSTRKVSQPITSRETDRERTRGLPSEVHVVVHGLDWHVYDNNMSVRVYFNTQD